MLYLFMNTEKQYIQVFNNGYILVQHEPVVLKIISQNLSPNNFYLQGLFSGKYQLELEVIQDELSELQQLRSQSQNKERDFGPQD